MNWEYKVVNIKIGTFFSVEDIEKQLNDQQHAQWEFVSMGTYTSTLGLPNTFAVFKRSKKAE